MTIRSHNNTQQSKSIILLISKSKFIQKMNANKISVVSVYGIDCNEETEKNQKT